MIARPTAAKAAGQGNSLPPPLSARGLIPYM